MPFCPLCLHLATPHLSLSALSLASPLADLAGQRGGRSANGEYAGCRCRVHPLILSLSLSPLSSASLSADPARWRGGCESPRERPLLFSLPLSLRSVPETGAR